jgi:hypothetical protein
VTPWAERVLQSVAVQYRELGTSHWVPVRCGYIIPLAVIANHGIPLGLILAPRERVESYEQSFHRLFETNSSLMEIADGCPVLTDARITV